MIDNRGSKYEKLKESISSAELAEDWETFIKASIEYGDALISDVTRDATGNGQLAWPKLYEAYQKAIAYGDSQLILDAGNNLMIVTALLLENFDSNQAKNEIAIAAGDFIFKIAKDDFARLDIVIWQSTILELKLQDEAKLKACGDKLTALVRKLKIHDFNDGMLFKIAEKVIAITSSAKDKGKAYIRTLKLAEKLMHELSARKIIEEADPEAGSWEVYNYALLMSHFLEVWGGSEDLVLEYLGLAFKAIEPISPIEAVNVMTDRAHLLYDDRNFKLAMKQLEFAEPLLTEIWNNSARMTMSSHTNAALTDLLMLPSYFFNRYEFGSQLALEIKKPEDAITWRERGLYRFYKAMLTAELEQQTLIGADILKEIEQLTSRQPDILFMHFDCRSPVTTCIAWTSQLKFQQIDLGKGLWEKTINLAGTEFENPNGCWDDYESWKRTASEGRLNRWLKILNVLSKKMGDLIFAPVLKKFNNAKINKLVVIMNGWMNGLPVQAARLGNDNLASLYSIVQLPSILSLKMLPVRQGKGMRVIDGLHADLPWAKAEIATITSFFDKAGWPVKKGFPENDAVERFADLLKSARENVIHIASHMVYVQNNTTEAAIHFNDGGEIRKFKMTDILNENNLAVNKGATVILSGCESSQVDFHRNIFLASISRAFLLSGASCVIGTSWIVDDMASYFLMNRLYLEWQLLSYNNLPEALRRSQDWLRQEPVKLLAQLIDNKQLKSIFTDRFPDPDLVPFANPYYWAAWSYSGVLN